MTRYSRPAHDKKGNRMKSYEFDKYPSHWGFMHYPKDNKQHFFVSPYGSSMLKSLCGIITTFGRPTKETRSERCHLCLKIGKLAGFINHDSE